MEKSLLFTNENDTKLLKEDNITRAQNVLSFLIIYERSMNQKWMNNHHRIPRSRARDWYNVHHQDNQWLINQKVHESIHNLFSNLCPHEQFEVLLKINKQVMNKHIVKLIQQAIYDQNFYLDHLITDGEIQENRRDKNRRYQ